MSRSGLLSFLIWCYLKVVWFTSRVKIIESELFQKDLQDKKPIVLAHWHGDELMLLRIVPRYKLCTMVSLSKDGQLMSDLLMRLGGRASRGSTSKGAVSALKGLIKLLRKGNVTSVAVDGPRGPIYKAKPGVFELSRLANARVHTMTAEATKSKVFENSWNKAKLPKPFGTIIICIGDHSLEVNKNQSAKDPKLAETLEFQLTDAKHKVRKLIANV